MGLYDSGANPLKILCALPFPSPPELCLLYISRESSATDQHCVHERRLNR